jgi:branched-subunit amino acid ABC-type transport system permease component
MSCPVDPEHSFAYTLGLDLRRQRSMTLFFSALIAGLAIGSIYGLVGIGYTVVYNATRTFNLAQGDLVMVGVMASFFLIELHHVPQLLAFFLVVIFVAAISVFEERVVVRPFLKRGSAAFGWFIATLGFSAVIETMVVIWLSNRPISAISTPFPTRGFKIGSVVVDYREAFVVVVFVAVIVALELFMSRTWTGQAMQATAEDREAVSLLGVNPVTMSQVGFLAAGVIAGIAAYVIAPITFSDPTIGLNFTLKGFLALAIGGFGSVRGAIAGGLILGVTEQLFDLYGDAKWEIVVGLALVLAVLLTRPEGLFRRSAARLV